MNLKPEKIIIGLGNPGFRYKKTRHNAGFLAVDYIQKNIPGFSKWKLDKKIQAEISENSAQSIILAKPQTYMNKSGEAVKLLMANGKWQIEDLFVIHDDFDLPISEFKIEKDRGAAGHKGVQSIIDTLNTNKFSRLRIGIRPSYAKASDGKPAYADLPVDLSAKALASAEVLTKAGDFVLKKFTRDERTIIEKIIPKAAKSLIKDAIN